jgi:hypothetical protein
MEIAWFILGVVFIAAVVAVPVVRSIAAKKKAGESVGWLDVALSLAQGIDDAKEQLDPEAKAKMGAALKNAAEKAGKHGDVEAFLKRFDFNKPK